MATASKPFKPSVKVEFTRRNGETVRGVTTTGEEPSTKGSFVTVNIGDKKNPNLVKVRPSQLARV